MPGRLKGHVIATPTPTPKPSPSFTPDDIAKQSSEFWNASIQWFQSHSLQILIGVAAAAVIAIALRFTRSFGQRLCRHDKTGTGWTTILGRAIAKTGNLFIFAISARLVVHFAQAPEPVAEVFNFIFVVATAFQFAIWGRELILGFIEHRTRAVEHDSLGSALNIIRLLVTVVVFAIALIVVLDNLGVNVTGLIAGLGVGGIAIGLAAQGIFSDLFAALSILFDKPFRRGDSVQYDQTQGTVEAIGLKSTRIRAITGEERVIANAQLLSKELSNLSQLERRRIRFMLGVTYQTDPGIADSIPTMLKEIVEANDAVFVRAGFINFGASTLDFQLDFDVMSPDYAVTFEVRHKIGLAILRKFNEAKIDFAYPTQTSFTAAPDGTLVMPYPDVQTVKRLDDASSSD